MCSMPPAKRRNRRQNENGETVKNIKKEVWEYIDFTLSTFERAKIKLPYAVQVDDRVLEHKQVDRGRRDFGLIGMERFRDRCMPSTSLRSQNTNWMLFYRFKTSELYYPFLQQKVLGCPLYRAGMRTLP